MFCVWVTWNSGYQISVLISHLETGRLHWQVLRAWVHVIQRIRYMECSQWPEWQIAYTRKHIQRLKPACKSRSVFGSSETVFFKFQCKSAFWKTFSFTDMLYRHECTLFSGLAIWGVHNDQNDRLRGLEIRSVAYKICLRKSFCVSVTWNSGFQIQCKSNT